MKPFGNIQSKNLKLVLFLARLLAVVGAMSLCLGLISFGALLTDFYFLGAMGFGILLTGFGILLTSCLMAAIVAFEESYRIRTECLVKQQI